MPRGRPGTIKPSGSLQRARLMTEPGSRFRKIIADHHKIILSSPVLIPLRALTLSVSTQTVSSLRCLLSYVLSREDLCAAWRREKGQHNAPFPPSLLGKEVADAAGSLSTAARHMRSPRVCFPERYSESGSFPSRCRCSGETDPSHELASRGAASCFSSPARAR